MTSRPLEIAGFLAEAGWGEATAHPLMGDLSPRRYARIEKPNGERAILMDADAEQKTETFVKIAEQLRRINLSAPEIFANNAASGLLILEDFGEHNVGQSIERGDDPRPYFHAATDALAHLHKHYDTAALPDLPLFDASLFASQTELFLDAYFAFRKKRDPTETEREDFRAAWLEALTPLNDLPRSLMLRDFMPDNLMYLPDRQGRRAIGILDFQDAGMGPIAYDIASLCDVVRRDLAADFLPETVSLYRSLNAPHLAFGELAEACVILAAQRHTRILGLIVRYVTKTGREHRLDYLPRIRAHLAELLRSPRLRKLGRWMEAEDLL